jgi:hypothetical protein
VLSFLCVCSSGVVVSTVLCVMNFVGSGHKELESIELNVGVCLLVACYRICVFPFCC